MNEEMNEYQMNCFSIISFVGSAKSDYVQSLQLSRDAQFQEAAKKIEEGKEAYVQAHRIHADMIAKEAGGEDVAVSLLLMHAESMLIDAESFRLNALEFLSIYRRLKEDQG